MISPEEAGKAGQNAVDALSRLEANMLIEAAAKLKASSLEGVDVSREAAELQATVREYARRDSNVAKALEQDIRGMLELDAGREAAAAGATPEQVATMATATEAAAQEAYREALRGASTLAANMTADVRRQYFQMANAASLQVTSGNMARDEATAWATSKMAERGISALETTTASGVRRTPVDVAMRQVIQEALMRRLTKQVTDIAALCGEDLVEVSSHGGARPSHAKWQGKVYSLSGKSEKYPPFYERCMARDGDFYDPVDGYGGYNCRHTIGIYREGYHRRWQDDPLVGKGYDNDEVYALQQRQRRYENDIRKLKREKEVLESQGYDARAVNARIRGKQAQLRQLIAENDSVLSRERWREQVTRTAKPNATKLQARGTTGSKHATWENESVSKLETPEEVTAYLKEKHGIQSWKGFPELSMETQRATVAGIERAVTKYGKSDAAYIKALERTSDNDGTYNAMLRTIAVKESADGYVVGIHETIHAIDAYKSSKMPKFFTTLDNEAYNLFSEKCLKAALRKLGLRKNSNKYNDLLTGIFGNNLKVFNRYKGNAGEIVAYAIDRYETGSENALAKAIAEEFKK